MQDFGKRIAALRHERQLTQAELEARAGLPPTTLSRVEKGERGLTMEQVHRLADGLRVEAIYLLGMQPRADRLQTILARIRQEFTTSQRQVISELFRYCSEEVAPVVAHD